MQQSQYYTEPALLFFSTFDVPPCEEYNLAFGNICCSIDGDYEGDELVLLQHEYSFAILVLASLLTLVMTLVKRHRTQSVGTAVLEIT